MINFANITAALITTVISGCAYKTKEKDII